MADPWRNISDDQFRACLWTEDVNDWIWKPVTQMWSRVIEIFKLLVEKILGRECFEVWAVAWRDIDVAMS
jgi:hypothetical protein